MRKLISYFLVTLLLSLVFAAPVSASGGAPVGGCPTGFQSMSYMDSCGGMPMHIGLNTDLNGDGYICVDIVTADLHVHVDNTSPVP